MDYEGEIGRQLPWLRKMAYMYCRQDADMEDLVSDTVLKLLLAKDVFKEKHAFRSFAYSVMQHVFINKYNRKKCVAFVEQFPTAEPHASSTADATIRAKDIIQRTRKASAQSVCIRPVIMYALGYSYQEIADILSIPMGTVQRRIHEGRKVLKKELGK